jgi:hypothetical protein
VPHERQACRSPMPIQIFLFSRFLSLGFSQMPAWRPSPQIVNPSFPLFTDDASQVLCLGCFTLTPRVCVDERCQSPTLDAVALTHISMPNTPAFILYHGRNTGKDTASKKIWTRIGAVWPNKSGKGFNLTWDYLPLGDGPHCDAAV